MADIKVVDGEGQEVQEEQTEPKQAEIEVVADGVMLKQSIADMFDLKPSEMGKYESKINTLLDYAKANTEDHSPENIKWALRSLSLKLGTPPLGEKLINYLTRYAHLNQERQKLDKELEKYEHGTA